MATFDLIVLGGGPAGTSAAGASGYLGNSVALVEKADRLGGAGINTGTRRDDLGPAPKVLVHTGRLSAASAAGLTAAGWKTISVNYLKH